MQRLRELSRRVEAVYGEIATTFSAYQQQRGLNCRSGCGECCLQPTIEATELEMLPLALHLFDQGKAEQTLTQLEELTEPQGCFFYQKLSFDGKQGQCSVYQQRPSICRLFGASGYRDKQGKTSLSVCKVIKTDRPLPYQQHLPVNDALQQALERVLFKAWYSGMNDDQQIA
jgi:Fe-S-cluster containining protein